MASLDFTATETPTDIVTGLSLAVGTTYACQNISTFATLRFREAVAMPGAAARAFRVEASGAFELRPEASIPIWVWTDDAPCQIIVSVRP